MAEDIDPVAQQTGFGIAAYLILTTLMDKLAEKNLLSRSEIKDILDWALMNAETHQTHAPSKGAMVAARTALEAALFASETKRRRIEGQNPP